MAHKRSTGLGGTTNLAVLAPIRTDMVVGFEPVSYLERLRKTLNALQSARQNVRESERIAPFFPDAIGRFGIIQHFRYALVPPVPGADEQPADGVWRLSLNVTFDGGWEPYMRVIYRDLGELLDLLFCHNPTYPGSRTSSFERYCAWVRENELDGGLFFADSAMPLRDHHYLAEVEKALRDGEDVKASIDDVKESIDLKITRIALPSEAAQDRAALARAKKDWQTALVLPLRTLKGLYRLSVYFPKNGGVDNPDGDGGTLRRFARSVLNGPMEVMDGLDRLPETDPDHAAWQQMRKFLADELNWLGPWSQRPQTPLRQPCDPTKLQSHILGGGDERMTHGCIVLLRVSDRERALGELATRASLCCGPVPATGVGCVVAFTHAGLKELGIAPQRLAALPQEFIDGMEARAALLGDVRGNHPDHWTRPPAHGQASGGRRVDLKTVHVVVLLRHADDHNASHELHDRLRKAVDGMGEEATTGLRVLAVQETRSYRNPAGKTVGHLEFVDGISQPEVPVVKPGATAGAAPEPKAPGDAVAAGEVLLGHANDRGDAADPTLDPLLQDGSFLVVRKLRQRVDHLDLALEKMPASRHEELLEKMMGRKHDGTPLVAPPAGAAGPNDFDYEQPNASDGCPFHAHIRRANPRDKRPYMPRLLRRGMSYGPMSKEDRSSERGMVFMAYCASIAEQFETVQRWLAGGNASGVGSAQGDPFLRVPQIGESTTFRYVDSHGAVARASFDDKPLTQLEWGLYLFVPSLAALRELHAFGDEAPAAAATPTDDEDRARAAADPGAEETERERVRQLLDDPDRARRAWRQVRSKEKNAPQDTAYGHLVGTHEDVLTVLKDRGDKYSVRGYGDRMKKSIGLNLLGLDPGPERTLELALNDAITAIGEKDAFDLTLPVVRAVIGKFPGLPAPNPGAAIRRPIDLVSFSDTVLAALCTAWIGVPDASRSVMDVGGRLDVAPSKPRCPGNFATTSRYIFSPHPRQDVETAGERQGEDVLKAVIEWLGTADRKLGKLAGDIETRLGADAASGDLLARSLSGVLLGFPPTVHGNFIRTLETWIETESLWEHQQKLHEKAPDAAPSYEQATAALRDALLGTMRQRPVPEMLWRSPVDKGCPDTTHPRRRVVLGIASALTDRAAPDELMFGRDVDGAATPTVHGCPGYRMAMGVMLAMIAGLMTSGTLRPTGSPVLLILSNDPPAPPPPPKAPGASAAAAAPPAPGATASASA